jgi:hypothetical protein
MSITTVDVSTVVFEVDEEQEQPVLMDFVVDVATDVFCTILLTSVVGIIGTEGVVGNEGNESSE